MISIQRAGGGTLAGVPHEGQEGGRDEDAIFEQELVPRQGCQIRDWEGGRVPYEQQEGGLDGDPNWGAVGTSLWGFVRERERRLVVGG